MAIAIRSAAIAKAPSAYPKDGYKIFLGGVIDMGDSEDWQQIVIEALDGYNVVVLSPRRDEWDSSWEQSLEDERFVEQVEWEIEAQESADLRLYVFGSNPKEAKKAKAPITLMEYGLHAKENTIVCCPEGYWRRGNIQVTCRYYNTPLYDNLDDLLSDLKSALRDMGLKNGEEKSQ